VTDVKRHCALHHLTDIDRVLKLAPSIVRHTINPRSRERPRGAAQGVQLEEVAIMELKGSVAVVTGGASGIGEAVAKTLAAKGVNVVIGDMDEKNLVRVSDEIVAAGGACAWGKCNVTNEEQVADLMDLAIAKFGALNICVASAGIIKDGLMLNTDKETGKVKKAMTTEQFRAVIDVNLVGAFVTLREAALRMVNNGYKGVLIPISSVNKSGQTGQLNYSSAKAALALWPKIIVGEFQMRGIQGIRCVAIAPGYVGTPMVKGMNQDALAGLLKGVHIGRLIEPEEIAHSIVYACENEAMDATCLEITGGLIANGLAK
jgi:3-oxoacyl-[acyl-carrier protein] reductase